MLILVFSSGTTVQGEKKKTHLRRNMRSKQKIIMNGEKKHDQVRKNIQKETD